MKLQLLRNATCLLQINTKKILMDPMLGDKFSFDPMPFTSNGIKNPTVGFPMNEDELKNMLEEIDLVLISHLHPDHWDAKAVNMIDKEKLIVCQPEDEITLLNQGFRNVKVIQMEIEMEALKITRTKAIHGTGEIGQQMGTTSGFVIESGNEKIYFAGDSIWCKEVKDVIEKHEPNVLVLNCGGARFDMGDPIIMDLAQLKECCYYYEGDLVCIHLEALNHCYTTREEIRNYLKRISHPGNWYVPEDGEEMNLERT